MNCFIIAAITTDGFIAKDPTHTAFTWTSKDDKKRFIELTKQAGVVVFGRTTYETIGRPLKDRLNIVYSTTKNFEGTETTSKEPQELLHDLEARGFKNVAICGGSHIYTLFIKAKVVTKIFLTTEPLLFGTGITLFEQQLDIKLKLVTSSTIPTGTIFAEYEVEYK